MATRLTFAFCLAMLCFALWQQRAQPDAPVEQPVAVQVQPPVEAQAPVEPRVPRDVANKPTRSDVQQFMINLRKSKQTTQFHSGLEVDDEALSLNAPGNSGPFDANGDLILPIDTRKRH